MCRFVVGIVAMTVVGSIAHAAIVAEVFSTGFSSPVFVTAPPGDPRLFVVEQDGLIRIIENGLVLPTPFLDLTSLTTASGERGLLGLAFHPDYGANGRFYVHYSATGTGATTIAEYQVSADPNVADDTSGTVLLTQAQPNSNHNGGMIAFKPGEAGNYLYVALGDGGGAGDPNGNGQNMDTILGAIIRMDVDSGGSAPASNPFVGVSGADLIWVYGLRNPWRFSFDRLTGDMYIGDVGQNNVEEVDFVPAGSSGGENFGWNLLEGSADFACTDCDGARMTTELPIHQYTHLDGVAITGGNVYRGSAIPSLQGTYFFADLNGRVWSFRYDGSTVSAFQERGSEFISPGNSIVSFGEDSDGELYIVDHGGTIYRINDTTATMATSVGGGGLYEEGDTVTLSVGVTGTIGNVTYEWYRNGSGPLADGGNVSGTDTPELILSPVAIADSGTYVLHVTDESKGLFIAPAISITVVGAGLLPAMGMLGLGLLIGIIVAAGIVLLRRRAGRG